MATVQDILYKDKLTSVEANGAQETFGSKREDMRKDFRMPHNGEICDLYTSIGEI
jgi:hypothetical protein